MTVFNTGPKATTTDFRAGDVGVVRKNLGHYVENTGSDVMQYLEVFRADQYEEVSLADWFGHLPPELLMQHLNLTREDLEKFPKRCSRNRPGLTSGGIGAPQQRTAYGVQCPIPSRTGAGGAVLTLSTISPPDPVRKLRQAQSVLTPNDATMAAPAGQGESTQPKPEGSPDGALSLPSVDNSRAMNLLPFVLSAIAGSVDVIGFLGLDALFTSHITGNLVIVAARIVTHEQASLASLIAVPVFMVALILTRLLVTALERVDIASLRPLLSLQFLLLSASFCICLAAGPSADPSTAGVILAGMLGVSAMAVQNALVRVSMTGAPSTAVMTTNVTTFAMDVGEMLFGRHAPSTAKAHIRAGRTWPVIVGFLLGCALGAPAEAMIGLRALVLPASLGTRGTLSGCRRNQEPQCPERVVTIQRHIPFFGPAIGPQPDHRSL